MTAEPTESEDFFGWDDDTDECDECGGEGGYARCQEDCCPVVGGEECCDDPVCWRVCQTCRGRGSL